ncbi:tRNA pseudouridine synthase, partial [Anaeromyces robustus]
KREFDFTKCCYRYIALKIAYFGWNYQGFAEQTQDKNVNTIEGHLFEVLKSLKLIQDRKTCHYSLCGRTDKGVSAFSQIVGLYVRSSLKNDPKKGIYTTENEMDYVSMLNRMLPIDIRVLAWSPIKSSFHARYNCSYRKYNYFFTKQDLDIELMQKACKKLEGLHDFRNFCKIDPTKHNKFERTIYSYISPYNPFDIYVFEIKSMAFLWHQVRCCMAILFLIGKHKENIDIIDKLFDVNDENDQGKPIYDLAPEIPLVLVDAGYPE